MCLGVPGKVIEVDGLVALVDFWGVRKQVRLDVVDEPVARRRLRPEPCRVCHPAHSSAADRGHALALRRAAIAAPDDGDLMATDVRGEIAAGERGGRDRR